jgi:hypothetical protein
MPRRTRPTAVVGEEPKPLRRDILSFSCKPNEVRRSESRCRPGRLPINQAAATPFIIHNSSFILMPSPPRNYAPGPVFISHHSLAASASHLGNPTATYGHLLADKLPPLTHWPARLVPHFPTFSHIFPPFFQTVPARGSDNGWALGLAKNPMNHLHPRSQHRLPPFVCHDSTIQAN